MIRLLASVLVLICFSAQSQDFLSWKYTDRYFSFYVGTGSTAFIGDVTGKIQTNPTNFNLGYEARLLTHVSARIEGYYYHLEGRDRWAKFGSYEMQRNHAFESQNWEGNFQLIYYFKPYQGDYYRRAQWEPYVGAGVGLTSYNPYRMLRGEQYFLRDIETEADKEPYGKTSLIIPITAGIKFKVNDFTNLNFELGYRVATTDYLDDVSGRYPTFDDNETSLTIMDLANPKDLIPTVNQAAYEELVAGAARGNKSSFDSYLFLTLKVEVYLPRPLFSGGLKKTSAK